MTLILLSYDQAILVLQLINTNLSRRSIVTFVAFITGISAIDVAKLAFVKPISTQHWRGMRKMGPAYSSVIKSSEPIQELVELDESVAATIGVVFYFLAHRGV